MSLFRGDALTLRALQISTGWAQQVEICIEMVGARWSIDHAGPCSVVGESEEAF